MCIKEKQAQTLLGSTVTLAFHMFSTPAGHEVGLDVWQHPGLARVSVRTSTRLSALTLGLTTLLFRSVKHWHMEHPPDPGKTLLTGEAGGNVLSFALLCNF